MKITKTKKGQFTTVIGAGKDRDGRFRTKRFTADTRQKLMEEIAKYQASSFDHDNHRTFSDALDAYLTAREPHRSPATIRGYKIIERGLKTHYSAFLTKETARIRDEDVQSLIDSMFRQGYSRKTIKNWLGLINSVLIAEKHPSAKVIMPQKQIIDRQIPTETEIRMMLCLLHGKRLEIPFQLAILGLRRSEICALTLSDLDRDDVLHIHSATVMDDDGIYQTKDAPKNDTSNRFVKLPHQLAEAIRRQGFVCDYPPNYLTQAYSRFLARYKFPSFRLHDCRHFFASYCHSMGVPEADILAAGGWKTSNIMRSVYRHSMAKNRAGDTITNLMSAR